VSRAIADAEAFWGAPVKGVFHLAGLFRQCSVLTETREGMLEIARPKVVGVQAIAQALRDRSGVFCVAWSSVNGVFGGFEASAYSAASSGLDAAMTQIRRRRLKTQVIGWSRWSDVGVMRDYALSEASRARGYMPIGVSQGLHSLLAVLHNGSPHVLVGLDSQHASVRALCESSPIPRQELCACVPEGTDVAVDSLARVDRPIDRFGTRTPCQLVHISNIPKTVTGEIDREALARRLSNGNVGRDVSPPESEIERWVARVWEELLGTSHINVTDSFFELGGHSLLATQMISRIRQQVQVDIPIQQVFIAPTIRELAEFIEDGLLSDSEQLPEEDAARLASGER
jgi:acyl carrier protein